MNNRKKSDKNKTLRALAQISHTGLTMAAAILIGVFSGRYLDGLFGTSPWLLLIFSLLGAAAAIRLLFGLA